MWTLETSGQVASSTGRPRRAGAYHRLWHAVGAEHGDGAVRHLRQLSTKIAPLALQALDHVPVVDDLVPDVDRRAVFLERPLDDLDRPTTPAQKPRG